MKRKRKLSAPPQITLGGKLGLRVWKSMVLPKIRNKKYSTWDLADLLGVSAMTVSRWRRAYL